MKDVSTANFGLLIAYLLPGFTALWGASYLSAPVRAWLGTGTDDTPTVGGFLYVTLASIAAGITVSTIRWLVIDTIHHGTGIPRPRFDFSRLQANILAFDLIVEHQYRYYQCYSNSLVSLVIVYVARHLAIGYPHGLVNWPDFGILVLACILFLGSRDTYRKYLQRGEMFLGRNARSNTTARRRSRERDAPSLSGTVAKSSEFKAES